MCDDAKIQGVVESGALDGIINSKVEKVIVNDDTTKEALYKKGCGLMKKVFVDNEETYSKKISEILEKNIPNLFENNTDFKIKVDKFKIESNNKKLFDNRMTRNALIQFGKVLNPGEVFVGKGLFKEGGPRQWVDKTKELATDEQIEMWTNKYGCDAQNGSIFITTADMGKDVAFSETSGISEEAKNNFIVGSQSGVYPIIKETNLR